MVVRMQTQALAQAILKKNMKDVRSALLQFDHPDAKVPQRKNRPASERPLMLAAEAGSLPIVRLLISKGSDANALNQFRQPALLYAIRANSPPIVTCLLKAGSDPNVKMHDGETLLAEAARKGVGIRIAKQLLAAGADPLQANRSGGTALHVAAFQNRLDVTKLLLRAGANPNARDRHAHGPVSCAILRENWDLATFLIKNGADPQKQPEALGVAASSGKSSIVRLLVYMGWDTCSKAHQNRTPLWHAQSRRHKVIVEFLQSTGT
jgi:ankyrin repeat protein